MQYSLKILNEKINFDNLNINEFIENLNLIGFEIDEFLPLLDNKKTDQNQFVFIVKIPANRQDLLIEKHLLVEFCRLFNGKQITIWKKFKNIYSFSIHENYRKYKNYKYNSIISNLPNILTSILEFEISEELSSPMWIQKRLITLGITPQKDIEDIVHLVNSEWGQSFNLFSNLEKEENPIFQIKQIDQSISFENSENNLYDLKPGTIVLTNQREQILSVLGLKHFKKERKLERSIKRYFVQVYLYDIENNFLNLQYFNNQISTKSLQKQFFENSRYAFQRLLTLFEIIYSIKINPVLHISKPTAINLKNNLILKLDLTILKKLLNLKTINSDIFEKTGLKIICKTKNEYYFSVPPSRKDIRREVDLVEEYSRYIGYKNFEQILPDKSDFKTKKKYENPQKVKKLIEQFFVFHGFNQILTNSLELTERREKKISGNNDAIMISNPLNCELTGLRTTLLRKLIQVFERNIKINGNQSKFFEIGKTFRIIDQKIIESEKLTFLFQLESSRKTKNSNNLDSYIEWFQAKAFVEQFLYAFGYKNLEIEKVERTFDFYHPKNNIFFFENSRLLGVFGKISPNLSNILNSKNAIFLAEFDIETFLQETRSNACVVNYEEYSKYPSIRKDLSFFVSQQTDFYELKKNVAQISTCLKSSTFFDIYFPDSVKTNNFEKDFEEGFDFEKRTKEKMVTVGMRLEFQSNKETLTNEFVDRQVSNIRNYLENSFSAEFNK